MKFLAIFLLVASACATEIEKREAGPSYGYYHPSYSYGHGYPHVLVGQGYPYGYRRLPIGYSYRHYHHKRSAAPEPEAESSFYHGHYSVYRPYGHHYAKRSADPHPYAEPLIFVRQDDTEVLLTPWWHIVLDVLAVLRLDQGNVLSDVNGGSFMESFRVAAHHSVSHPTPTPVVSGLEKGEKSHWMNRLKYLRCDHCGYSWAVIARTLFHLLSLIPICDYKRKRPTSTGRHSLTSGHGEHPRVTMKFLAIVLLAASACAAAIEKRDAEPDHHYVYPYGYRNYHPYYPVAYGHKHYHHKRSAEPEPEASPSKEYYPVYHPHPHYHGKRSADPYAYAEPYPYPYPYPEPSHDYGHYGYPRPYHYYPSYYSG
ncbi:uncharacterized protein LOC135218114 [Macrobrachium nipponense]|uniref:uncharacterized protein LOC135218114 n=1 Tax=Macrobrachium nipponense TaxID=159736 RepID=UPI0030C8385C